jgi:four helix bundle protein
MYKQNIVKDKSYEFALVIIGLVKKFPRNNEGFILGKQLLRSATSIGANVEEAIGAFTKNDFTYKMSLALKEARETNYWLRLVRDSKIVKTKIESYIEASEELRKILTAIVKKSKGDDR